MDGGGWGSRAVGKSENLGGFRRPSNKTDLASSTCFFFSFFLGGGGGDSDCNPFTPGSDGPAPWMGVIKCTARDFYLRWGTHAKVQPFSSSQLGRKINEGEFVNS